MKNKYLAAEINTSQGNYRVIVGKSILNFLAKELCFSRVNKNSIRLTIMVYKIISLANF